jgi:hypothetical protein
MTTTRGVPEASGVGGPGRQVVSAVSGLSLGLGFGLLLHVGRSVRDEGCGRELRNPRQQGARFSFSAQYLAEVRLRDPQRLGRAPLRPTELKHARPCVITSNHRSRLSVFRYYVNYKYLNADIC